MPPARSVPGEPFRADTEHHTLTKTQSVRSRGVREQTEPSPQEVPFATELRGQVGALRESLASILEQVNSAPPASGTEVRNSLGVDTKLAYQVFDLYTEGDDLAFSAQLPSARRLEAVAHAARSAGVAGEHVDRFEGAVSSINGFIARHAGQRWRFDAIVSCLSSSRADDISSEVDLRRSAMQSAARALGATVSVLATAALIGPRLSDHDRYDVAWMQARLGVRRLKPGARIPLFARRFTTARSGSREPVHIPPPEPVFPEPAGSPPGAHLVPGRCSPEGLPIQVVTTGSGYTIVELCGEEIGEASSCDVVTASFNRQAAPATRSAGDPTNTYSLKHHIRYAAERGVSIVGYPIGVVSQRAPSCTRDTDAYQRLGHQDLSTSKVVVPRSVAGLDALASSLGCQPVSETVSSMLGELGWDGYDYTFFVIDERFPSAMSTVTQRIQLSSG